MLLALLILLASNSVPEGCLAGCWQSSKTQTAVCIDKCKDNACVDACRAAAEQSRASCSTHCKAG